MQYILQLLNSETKIVIDEIELKRLFVKKPRITGLIKNNSEINYVHKFHDISKTNYP